MTKQDPIAVVAGVGPGLGAALCRKLAAAGYAVAGLARSTEFGDSLAAEVVAGGGRMSFAACDLTRDDGVEEVFSEIEQRWGAPSALVYNAGAFLAGSLADTAPEDFKRLWTLNCYGAYLCARRVAPGMLEHGGAIVFTGATAAVKAAAGFSAFGSSKFALRGLAQSLARELGPKGVHVAHVVIDGVIWTPRTSGVHGLSESQCLKPENIADTYIHLLQQERSAWTHELDIRPDLESF